jgi:hypothetical protein
MLAIGSVDERGAVWSSVLFGAREMVSSADGGSVLIDRRLVSANGDDPLWRNLRIGSDVGLLAIDLASRRRLRINGTVSAFDDRRVEVGVREAYPNCPKYIQRRHIHDAAGATPAAPQARASGESLDPARSLMIERADTLFVASAHPARGVDVSHRGGAPGFVRVLHPRRLRMPDYPGNSMFNTFGNFAVDDRAGLTVVDFEGGRLLQMTGRAAVRFDEADDPRQPTGGSGRYWEFDVLQWLELPVATRLAWELLDRSPHNPNALK